MFTFLLLSPLLTRSQTTCPSYQCSSLESSICMSWSKGIISLNSNGCPSKSICSLEKAMIEYALNPESGSYSCETSSSSDSISGYNYCGKDSKYKKSLKSGSFPKECSIAGYSDENCLLDDGSYLECRCGLQSKLYCNPNPDSEVFDDYWSKCDDEDYVVKAGFYNYYKTLYEFYVEYHSALSCSKSLFKEFSVISAKVPSSDSGMQGLVVSFGIFLVMFN